MVQEPLAPVARQARWVVAVARSDVPAACVVVPGAVWTLDSPEQVGPGVAADMVVVDREAAAQVRARQWV